MRNEWKAIFPRNYDKRPRVRVRVRVTCPECAKQVLPANASQEKGKEAQDKYQESEQKKSERKENLKARRKEYRESEKGKAAIKKWEKIGNFFSREHKLEHVRWTLRRHFTGVRHRARMIKNL